MHYEMLRKISPEIGEIRYCFQIVKIKPLESGYRIESSDGFFIELSAEDAVLFDIRIGKYWVCTIEGQYFCTTLLHM